MGRHREYADNAARQRAYHHRRNARAAGVVAALKRELARAEAHIQELEKAAAAKPKAARRGVS